MKFTSMGKKIVAVLAVFAFMLGLAGCVDPKPQEDTLEKAQQNVEAVIGVIVFAPEQKDSLTTNLLLNSGNSRYPNVKVEWTSSEEDIITITEGTDENGKPTLQGVVNRPDFNDPRVENGYVSVTLTVKATQTVSEGTATADEKYTFRVKAVGLDKFGTVAEIKEYILKDVKDRKVALNVSDYKNGKFCITYARVLYKWSKSMVISDGTGSMIVYGTFDQQQGDLVKVQGKVYAYYGQVEFGSEVQVTKLGEKDEILNPETKEVYCTQDEIVLCKYTDMEIQAYTDALIAAQNDKKQVVDIAGIMGFSGATYKLYAKVLKEDLGCGDKYALEDPKTGTKISIYHYSTDDKALTEVIDQFVGKYVYINCITVDRYSTNDVFRVLWNGEQPVNAPAPELTDADKLQQALNELKNTKLEDAYYNDQTFALPTTTVEGVTVEWAANDALVDGKLVVAEDGNLEFTATVTCGEETAKFILTINVYKEMKFVTVAEAKAAAKDSLVLVKGLVSAVYARGFVLYDTTGSVLVYANKAVDVKVGDYVKVSGKMGAYPADSTAYQIGSPSYEILTESTELALPEAVEWTGADVKAAWDDVVANKYNFAGNLVKMTVKISVSGNYFNATIDGADTQLSISYPLESVKGYLVNDATITGYFVPISYSLSSGSPKFFNLILVDVEAGEQQQAEALVSGLNVPTNVEADFDLPTVEGVAWSMKEANAAAVLEGTKVTVTRGEADVEVVFVATAKVGEATATKEYTVVVKGTVEKTTEHAGTEADPYNVADARMVCDKLEDKAYSDEMYYVKGIVISVSFNSKYSSYTLYIGDTADATEQFQVYSGNLAEGVEAPVKGATVVAYGYMQKYGTNLELSGKNGVYPTISSVSNPEVTDQQKVEALINGLKVPATVEADFELPTVEGVTWAMEANAAATIEGTKVTVTRGEEDVTLLFVATAKVGEATATKEYTVVVKANNNTTTGPVASFDFGTKGTSGYAANKELTFKNTVTDEDVTVVAHYTQTATSSGTHAESGAFAVICPVRANNDTKAAYLEFSFETAVNSVEFDATWWSASDSNNASKIAKFEVQYSTDGENWTTVTLSVSDLDASAYKTFKVECPNAKYVRIYAEGDNKYTSNQNARIAVDNVKFY